MPGKTLLEPIRNGLLQSDLDAKGYLLLNVGGVGDSRAKTVIIDGTYGNDSVAQVNVGIPFKTLGAAIAGIIADQHLHPDDHSGYVVEMRPGTYAFDGTQELHTGSLLIRGYGARITPDTATNEQTKLIVSSGDIVLEGLELDGLVDLTMLPAGWDDDDAVAGAIQVNRGTNLTIRDCHIHDWAGAGVFGVDGYGGLKIEHCTITGCQNGAFLTISGPSVIGVDFIENTVQSCRRSGLLVKGSANSSTKAGISNLHCERNDFAQNGTQAAIVLRDYTLDALVSNNYIQGSDGILLHHCKKPLVIANQIWNSTNPIIIDGCQVVDFKCNTIDGRNSAGVPITSQAITVQGFYAVADDNGPMLFSGNTVYGLGSLRRAFYIVDQNNVLIVGNRLHGLIFLQDARFVQTKTNTIVLDNNNACVIVQTNARDVFGIEITGNRFTPPAGGAYDQVIKTATIAPFVITALFVTANTSSDGRTYAVGTINHTGAAPTAQYTMANAPANTDITRGWVNDMEPDVRIKTVVVSQTRGDDATGARQRGDLPFLTINAAITAAANGDDVVVEDGTFNERLQAKNGITVRFQPAAKLLCTNVDGCIQTTADNQAFIVYHEHTPIVCSQASTSAILTEHVGAYIGIHGSVKNTGAAPFSHCLDGSNGTIEVWGYVNCSLGIAITSIAGGGNFPFFIIHGGLSGNYDVVSGNQHAIELLSGSIKVIDGTIAGATAGVIIHAALCRNIFKRCSIYGNGSSAAVYINTNGSEDPIFRDCILISGSSATKTIDSSLAQDILIYGTTTGNKGANPPANITLIGGGTYAVSADLFAD
jgi:hypothetical protein